MGNRKRYIEYDLIRIVACFCVIMIHCAVFEQNKLYVYNTLEFQANNIWGVLSRWAVPVFVMLSGMMILEKVQTESLRYLLFHRVFRMLVVYIVWSGVYSFYNVFALGNIYAGTKLKTFIDGCFSGEIHMWYLPMLAGLYFISPILSSLIKNIEEKITIYWLCGLTLVSSIIPFIIKLNIKFISVIVNNFYEYAELQFLGGWTLYFVLGFYIQKHNFNIKEKRIIYGVAILSIVFTMFATVGVSWNTGEALGVLPYEYPNIVCMGIGIMVFAKEELSRIRFNNQLQKMIIAVSKLTFGIYLSHVLILKILYMIGINMQICHPLLSIPIVSLITFIVGAIVTLCVRKIPYLGCYIA